MDERLFPEPAKPLASECHHQWAERVGPFLQAQLCPLCMLFRYKTAITADWEYRAPIPVARAREQDPGSGRQRLG